MKVIHKIAAMVIENDKFLMVRKVGKEHYTNLGGKPEGEETEEQALVREIEEELACGAEIIRKLGDFEAPAIHDDAVVRLSTYLVKLVGEPKVSDPEIAEFKYIGKDYGEKGIKLPGSITNYVLPYCIEQGLLQW